MSIATSSPPAHRARRAPTTVRVLVCLPTYNERDNLEAMISALGRVLGRRDRILVIDDGSPDGTGELAERLAEEHEHVEVLHRTCKAGLGPAYLAGFGRALELDAQLVVTMDCDFSHDPRHVPELIAAAMWADVVVGSRAAPGGTDDRPFRRKLISRAGSLYARTMLGLPVRDATAGFKCIRGDVLRRIDLDRVSTKGYAFNIELAYRAVRAGFRIVEHPIAFADRSVGASKMSRTIVFEALLKVPALRAAALIGRL
jgi:dolichol-phosphate mannosyltransferase